MTPKEQLIIALDVASLGEAERLVTVLGESVIYYKVGLELFIREGLDVICFLRGKGKKIFLDLKLHDIPNTVRNAARAITALGVEFITVHTAGGTEMLCQAAVSVKEEAVARGIAAPRILGVTVLTSIGQEELNQEIGIPGTVEDKVTNWAIMARDSGLDGVVASPRELKAVRQACGRDFLVITPGIRPLDTANLDQKRVFTPKEAVAAGASYLVIGRPITAAPDPQAAALRIMEEMEGAY